MGQSEYNVTYLIIFLVHPNSAIISSLLRVDMYGWDLYDALVWAHTRDQKLYEPGVDGDLMLLDVRGLQDGWPRNGTRTNNEESGLK